MNNYKQKCLTINMLFEKIIFEKWTTQLTEESCKAVVFCINAHYCFHLKHLDI